MDVCILCTCIYILKYQHSPIDKRVFTELPLNSVGAVSKDFSADEESVIIRMVQSVAVPLLGNMCHVFMHGLNRVQVGGIALFVTELFL